MYSKEEKKNLRSGFWTQFKTFSNKRNLKAGKPGKWIMEATGIKQLKLKFHFDTEIAWTGIEIDTRNLDKRIELFDKFEKLKTILDDAVPEPLIWDLEVKVTELKTVSRIYAVKKDVNIYDKSCWKIVNSFLYSIMAPIEDVYREYYDFLKY